MQQKLNRSRLEKHWQTCANSFRSEYRAWADLFWDVVTATSDVLALLEGKKRLAENCSYLLLSKSLNHALAAFSLAERGLCIDAALASRNAVEALLLLQVLMLDASEDVFRRLSEAEQFKPGWVRNELKAKSSATVRDVIVNTDQETHELNRMVYAWLSNITDANRASVNQTAQKTGDESYEIFVGGSLVGMKTLMNAIFATLCYGLHETAVICMAVFDAARLEKTGTQWSALEKQINEAAHKAQSTGTGTLT
jgi:hypothetical protein